MAQQGSLAQHVQGHRLDLQQHGRNKPIEPSLKWMEMGSGLKEKWFYLLLFCLKMEEMWLYVYTTGKVWQHRGEIRDQGRRREWDPLRRLARVMWASWRQKAKGKTVKREKAQGSTEHHPGILHVNQTFCCCCCSRKFAGSFLSSRHCSEVCDTILWDFIKKKKKTIIQTLQRRKLRHSYSGDFRYDSLGSLNTVS